ncbi:methyltransferase [Leptolyngbya iicbica]|uniref:Methyltransferase domain-containing protein n=2 Tax=Cyanophyceae TaxID=3028117 RepID=A0A4Q7E498_9CYAN|nr:methyltransferase [Leptolyngbya sp. LK]RZM76524.1 methyltransferase domain-containing protein [Leptolyngbya sp. LK]
MRTQQLQISHLTVQLMEHPEVWSPLSAVEMLSFLVEHGILKALDQQQVLDFGTGSGIVGIVCGLLGATSVTLSDYSAIAAQVAAANARQNGLTNVMGVQSDRFQQIPPTPYDLVISNPPVQPWLFTNLDQPDNRTQVAAWNEAGADGRLVLDALLTTAMQFLGPGGRLITSSSSRHGHRQTLNLLDTYWPQRWRQIYAAQHAILPDYHGPYIQIWQHLQALDGDLRIYQLDERDRRFAPQTDAAGNPIVITELSLSGPPQPTILRLLPSGDWAAESPQGDRLTILSAQDDRLPGKATSEHWYYEYYLFEAWREG